MILDPIVPRHACKKRKDHQISRGRDEHQKPEKDGKPFPKEGTNSDRKGPKEKTGQKKCYPVRRSAPQNMTFGIRGQGAPVHPKVYLAP